MMFSDWKQLLARCGVTGRGGVGLQGKLGRALNETRKASGAATVSVAAPPAPLIYFFRRSSALALTAAAEPSDSGLPFGEAHCWSHRQAAQRDAERGRDGPFGPGSR